MRKPDRLGIVSNCWRAQLENGVDIESLVDLAVKDGFRFIELRQGCLGDAEDRDSLLPKPDRLAELAERFAGVQFDLAVQLPFFSTESLSDSHGMSLMLDAAASIGGHLRIVDLQTTTPVASQSFIEVRSSQLDEWQSRLGGVATVSIEHAMQPWSDFWSAFEPLRSVAPDLLKLCYDPCNLLLTNDGARAVEITSSVPVEALSMVHLKQSRNGSVLPVFVTERAIAHEGNHGDGIDWAQQLALLNDRRYAGPLLFEIAPGQNVQRHLREGRQWVIDQLDSAD